MEFPDLVLALIREFSRPRVNKEALEEYQKVVCEFGYWPSLKRKMVTLEAVVVVREFNRLSKYIKDIEVEQQELFITFIQEHNITYEDIDSMIDHTPRVAEIDRILGNIYDERAIAIRNLYVLVAGEAAVLEFERTLEPF